MNNIHVSPFFVFALLVRLDWQVYCRNSFQLPSFFPDSKKPFCNTGPFSGNEESSTGLSTLPCLRESPSLNRFHRVYWIIKFFSQYCLPHASKQSIIWELFHLLSKAFYFFTYEIIHITESTAKLCRFKKY